MRKWIISALVVVVLGTAGVLVYVNRPAAEPKSEPKPLPTAAITRGDLVSSVQQTGQLGYAGDIQLVGARQGTITALPRAGQVINRGSSAYSVDQRPIPLLSGSLPVFRQLAIGVRGEDVRQLERNLVDMGHGRFTVDDSYSQATANAVKHWQAALGVPETGVVQPGDAVVAPGPVRVTSVQPVVGAMARPGEPILTGTGTGHSVRVDLDRRYRSLVTVDQRVRIQLFGGRAVDGVVSSIESAATPAPQPGPAAQQQPQQQPQQRQNIPMQIAVTSPEAELGGVFEGPVTVTFPGETRRGVLTVPVEALTVVAGGAYAVVVVNSEGRHPVEVDPGLFTTSRVEISGAGLVEGMHVEVPTI
jgi:peptidoglycan hydrolase-like protein with peptidoglycan-binding domain